LFCLPQDPRGFDCEMAPIRASHFRGLLGQLGFFDQQMADSNCCLGARKKRIIA
jgi:hypothetical protein